MKRYVIENVTSGKYFSKIDLESWNWKSLKEANTFKTISDCEKTMGKLNRGVYRIIPVK